jgi:hypothetical protein
MTNQCLTVFIRRERGRERARERERERERDDKQTDTHTDFDRQTDRLTEMMRDRARLGIRRQRDERERGGDNGGSPRMRGVMSLLLLQEVSFHTSLMLIGGLF